MNKNKSTMGQAHRRESLFCLCMVGLFIVQWLVFWVYANFNSIRMAFTQYDPGTMEHELLPASRIFENFTNFFSDLFGKQGGGYFLNGALFHLIASIVCLPLNYMIAFIIYKKLPMTGFFKVALYLPTILSGMVISLMMKYGIEHGFAAFFRQLTGENFPYVFSDTKYNLLVLCLYQFFFGLGINLVVLGSMARIPEELVEYGKLEGLSIFQEFIYLAVPLIFPVIQVQCLGLFTGFFTNQGPLYSMYANSAPENVRTFGYYMFISIIGGNGAEDPNYMYGYVSAANLSIGLISVPIVQGTKKLFDLFDPEAEY